MIEVKNNLNLNYSNLGQSVNENRLQIYANDSGYGISEKHAIFFRITKISSIRNRPTCTDLFRLAVLIDMNKKLGLNSKLRRSTKVQIADN